MRSLLNHLLIWSDLPYNCSNFSWVNSLRGCGKVLCKIGNNLQSILTGIPDLWVCLLFCMTLHRIGRTVQCFFLLFITVCFLLFISKQSMMGWFASSARAPTALLHSSELGSSRTATSMGKALSWLQQCPRLPARPTGHSYSCQCSPWPQLQDKPWAWDLATPPWGQGTADCFLCKESYYKQNTLVWGSLHQLSTKWWIYQVSCCKALCGLGLRQRKGHGRQSPKEVYTVKLKLTVGRRVLALSWRSVLKI